MASERDIVIAMQEAVRAALCEAANKEIEKQKQRFEAEMTTAKRKIVCEIVNQIQIAAKHNLPTGEYVIQIHLNGGKKDADQTKT